MKRFEKNSINDNSRSITMFLQKSQIISLENKSVLWLAMTLFVFFLQCALFGEDNGSATIINYGPGKEICKLENLEINESSGIACSQINDGVFWTHNDSGSQPLIYAFDKAGNDLGIFSLKTRMADCEDIASVKIKSKPYLIVADVGDNSNNRKEVAIYIIEEPKIKIPKKSGKNAKKKKPILKKTRKNKQLKFSYENGPVNCESVAIDQTTGMIYLVEKSKGRKCKVYELASPLMTGKKKRGKQLAKVIAEINLPTTTAMDISNDGKRMLILSYGAAYEFSRKNIKEPWKDVLKRTPRTISMPHRVQGESVCYGRDNRTIFLTSECKNKGKTGCPFYLVPPTE